MRSMSTFRIGSELRRSVATTKKLPGRLAFDEKADIRSEKIAFVAHAARVLVVRVFAGIVSVAPAAAVAALPVIIFGIAPVAALLHPEVLVVHEGRFDILGRFLPWAGRGRIGPRDGERQLKKNRPDASRRARSRPDCSGSIGWARWGRAVASFAKDNVPRV